MDDLELPRTCARCRRVRPTHDFPLRRQDGTKRYGHCRDCKAAYQRQWYERNAVRHRARTAAARRAQREESKRIVEAAKNVPCADCDRQYPPYVMDFDHVRGQKVGNIAHLKVRSTAAALAVEIAKCEVVCANCHRIRSHERLQGLRT